MFHKEGFKIIGITGLACVVINILNYFLIDITWLQWAIFGASLIVVVLILQFFRNPSRQGQSDQHHILAPVDGKVVAIEEIEENEFFHGKRLQLSVFMSPLNVHVTRYPVGGKIVYSKYHPGKYLVAWHPKSSEKNERTTVVIDTDGENKVMYRQIAGALARRIVNYAEPEETVVQGDDSGFIKFGSRVDVLLPVGTAITVDLEEKVRGGESIIAQFK